MNSLSKEGTRRRRIAIRDTTNNPTSLDPVNVEDGHTSFIIDTFVNSKVESYPFDRTYEASEEWITPKVTE